MPLRSKSAFQIVAVSPDLSDRETTCLLQAILEDDPLIQSKDPLQAVSSTETEISRALQHRDVVHQSSGALALTELPLPDQLSLISAIKAKLGSDYGVHYLLTLIVGRLHLHQLPPSLLSHWTQRAPRMRDRESLLPGPATL